MKINITQIYVKIYFASSLQIFRPALGPAQALIYCVPGNIQRVNFRCQELVELYLYSPYILAWRGQGVLTLPSQAPQLGRSVGECCHSLRRLSQDKSVASSKVSSPDSAIQSFLFHIPVSSFSLKFIEYLSTASSSSLHPFCLPFSIAFQKEFPAQDVTNPVSFLQF